MKNIKKILLFSLLSIIFGGSFILLGNVAIAEDQKDIIETKEVVEIKEIIGEENLVARVATAPATGSIKICKIILNSDGDVVVGDSGTTFTIPFVNRNYEGANAGVPDSVIFDTPLSQDSLFGDIKGECETIYALDIGRYYYGQEEISDSENWQAPKYFDGANGNPALNSFGLFNSDLNASNDNFDGVINIGNGQTRTLYVLNQMKPTATIHATKIVCDSESYLPNWGNNGADINSTTASTFLANNSDYCHEVPWTFEYIKSDSEPNPKTDSANSLDGWTSFSSDSSTKVPVGKIWVREQADEDYIPFKGVTTTENVSAEIYCDKDVYNYDNLEYIDTIASQTHYCVAFNVPTAPLSSCNVVSDTTNIVEDGVYAEETYDEHQNWIPETTLGSIAKWIWNKVHVSEPINGETQVFVKKFNVDGILKSAVIKLAADNGYKLEINGDEVGDKLDQGDNFSSSVAPIEIDVTSFLKEGENIIRFTVENFAQTGGTYVSNPAGLLYNLEIKVFGSCEAIEEIPSCSEGQHFDKENNSCVDDEEPFICDPNINLIKNGGFENPRVPEGWETFMNGTNGLDWSVNWISGGVGALELQAGVNGWLPTIDGGRQYAELDSNREGTTDAATKIWQNVATKAGYNYKLEFDYSPRPKVADNTLKVFIEGIWKDTFNVDGSSNNNTAWQKKSYTFTADGDTEIKFVDDSISDSLGGFIDNVGLYCQNIDPEDKNEKPFANAGSGQNIILPINSVTLDGSSSYDPDGSIVSYNWTFVSGPTGIINPTYTGINPTVSGLIEGTYVFELIVIDNEAMSSDSNSVTIIVSPNSSEDCPEGQIMGDNGCYTPEQQRTVKRSSGSLIAQASEGRVLGETTTCGIYIDKYLRRGYNNDKEAVLKLQNFLNANMQAGLKEDGIFGLSTENALKAFQMAHADTILTPWNITKPTGIFYLTTQTTVNNIMCPELNLTNPTLVPYSLNYLAPKKA